MSTHAHIGLNNILLRLWNAISLAKAEKWNKDKEHRDKKPILLLPYARNRPCAYNPVGGLGNSFYLPFKTFYETKEYCQALKELGVDYLCQHAPPALAHLESQWSEKMPHGIPIPATRARKGLRDYPDDADVAYFMPDMNGDKGREWLTYMNSLKPVQMIQTEIDKVEEQLKEPYVAVHMRIENDWRVFAHGKLYVHAKEIVAITRDNPMYQKFQKLGTKVNVFAATGAKVNHFSPK